MGDRELDKKKRIAIFHFEDIDERAVDELTRVLKGVMSQYGIIPIIVNRPMRTLGRAEILDILKDGFKELS